MTGGNSRWNLPAWWWGPLRSDQTVRSLPDLVAGGVLDAPDAALLQRLVSAGASTIVCAIPGGAGKTTLLTALLPSIAAFRTPLVVRGMYDPLDQPETGKPDHLVILINELSPHLPRYLWGRTARRVFELGIAGAQLMATAHADSARSLIHQLMTYPTSATAEQLRLWDLVIFLEAWRTETGVRRQIVEVVSLSGAAEHGIPVDQLAERSAHGLVWNTGRVAALEERLLTTGC